MNSTHAIGKDKEESHLKYGIGHTDGDDSYLVIKENKKRHPIAFYELNGSVIHWINAAGEHESIGGEHPLPDYLIDLAKNKELYIMEMDEQSDDIKRAFFVNAAMLRL